MHQGVLSSIFISVFVRYPRTNVSRSGEFKKVSPSPYVELHAHSGFSFLDGASHPEELVLRAKELGYPALALTDHNGLYGSMEFARAAKEEGIQPITGAEVSIDPATVPGLEGWTESGHAGAPPAAALEPLPPEVGFHLTLLAETPRGYANLCRLLTQAHMEAADRRNPLLPFPALLDPERAQGLILLTGCRRSPLWAALQDSTSTGEALLRRLLDAFGPWNVFVELQENSVKGDRNRNRRMARLADQFVVPVVATGNVHYHRPGATSSPGCPRLHPEPDHPGQCPPRPAAQRPLPPGLGQRRWPPLPGSSRRPLQHAPHRPALRRLRPHQRPGLRVSRLRRGRKREDRHPDPGRDLPGSSGGALSRGAGRGACRFQQHRAPAIRQEAGRRREAPGGGAPAGGAPRPLGLLPGLPGHHEPGPGRGLPGAGRGTPGPLGPSPGTGPGLVGLLHHLLPHRPLPHRPGGDQPLPGPFPERGPEHGAGHRPGLSPGHPGRAHPGSLREVRKRARRPGVHLSHLPPPLGGPGDRKGAGASPGGPGEALQAVGAPIGRRPEGGAGEPSRVQGEVEGAPLAGPRGAGRGGSGPPPAPLPARGWNDHLLPPLGGDRPPGAGGLGRAGPLPVGQGLLRGRRLHQDRLPGPGNALPGGGSGGPHRRTGNGGSRRRAQPSEAPPTSPASTSTTKRSTTSSAPATRWGSSRSRAVPRCR